MEALVRLLPDNAPDFAAFMAVLNFVLLLWLCWKLKDWW